VIRLLFKFIKITRNTFDDRWGVIFLFLFSMLVYATSGFMYFEHEAYPKNNDGAILTWEDAIWWAIVSMTTVGYGDYFPTTTLGRLLVGLPTMLIGVAILGYILSALAAILMENKLKELKGMSTSELGKHIIICRFFGLTSSMQLIQEIRQDSQTEETPIIIIDENLNELPRELAELDVTFIKGDPASDSVLERANLAEAESVILQAELADTENSDLKNLAIALNIEKQHPEINTVVHCLNPDNIRLFERCGCDSVVCIIKLVNQVIVQELQDSGVHKMVSELTSNTFGKQFYVTDIPSGSSTFGDVKTAMEKNDSLAIGIRRAGQNIMAPKGTFGIESADQVISIGSTRN